MSNPMLKLVARRTLATYRRKRCTEINGVIHIELKKPSKAPARKSEILRKGTVIQRGGLPSPSDVQVEWDVLVTMRDGAVLLTDIFKPVGETSVPAIVAWSPYGKRDQMAFLTKGIGTQLSGLQKFEAPDPAVWVARGYAVLNPDTRGALHSEGNLSQWGTQDGQDGYDFTEWIAEQPWSNGKVGFAGNSWLAISQW